MIHPVFTYILAGVVCSTTGCSLSNEPADSKPSNDGGQGGNGDGARDGDATGGQGDPHHTGGAPGSGGGASSSGGLSGENSGGTGGVVTTGGTGSGGTGAGGDVGTGGAPGSGGTTSVSGCTDFVDRSGADADRDVEWGFVITLSEERCMIVAVGQSVVYEGNFGSHPIGPSDGDTPNPFASLVQTISTATVTFTQAGTYGFECGNHATMWGAVRAVEP